jgi:hypothetical protein
MRRFFISAVAFLAVLVFGRPSAARTGSQQSAPAQSKQTKYKERSASAVSLPQVITRDADDPAILDLFHGIGGTKDAPDPNGTYTFLEEDLEQTQPKFDVKDANGVRWRVKVGPESRAETAATRLVWAAGYFVDEDYYLVELKVQGLPKLHRGEKYVSEDGIVHGARLERKPKNVKVIERWPWFHNPFVGTRELNGLRVMMALINNWDLPTKNNSIYAEEGQRRYVVSDLGSSLGRTGDYVSGSRGQADDYSKAKFIDKTTPDAVNFTMRSNPIPVTAFEFRCCGGTVHPVVQHIPRADARWVGQRLSQLSDEQIRDCFRAASFSPEDVETYLKVVRKRIAELNAL